MSGYYKNYKLLPVIALVCCLFSCRAYINMRYGFNRPFRFNNREAFLSFLESRMKINRDHVIYPDTIGNNFYQKMSNDTIVAYYGCFLNDSIEIARSVFLKENTSCIGRVLKEIKENNDSLKRISSISYLPSDFREFYFRYAVNNQKFGMNDSAKKLKIVLVYLYAYGTYYNRFYQEVVNFYEANKHDIELYVIAPEAIIQ